MSERRDRDRVQPWPFLRGRLTSLGQCQNCILIVAVLLLSATIVASFVLDFQNRYRAAISDAEQTARQFSNVLAEHTARTLEGAEHALTEAEQIRRLYNAGVLGTAKDAHDALRLVKQSSPVIMGITWTNAAGDVVVHSYDDASPRSNISDLSYFVAHRDNIDSGLIIAPPFLSFATGNAITSASRRIPTPDSNFAGIVSVVLDPSYFSGTYRSIIGNSNAAVLLLHRGGEILVREPNIKASFGRSYRDSPLLSTKLPKSDTGSYEGVSVVDGIERVIGYSAVQDLPLVMLVSYPRVDVLAPWYRTLYIYGSIAALQLLIILIGTAALVRRTNSLTEAKRSIEGHREDLRIQNMRFKAALDHMGEGLCMFDAAGTLVVCNDRFISMYNLPPNLMKVGTPFRDIVAHRVKPMVPAGENINLTVERKIQALNQLPRDKPNSRIEELVDGRLIQITRQPLERGGWVSTLEDVTDRHLNEARVSFMAHHDLLTGLANRAFFTEKIEDAVADLRRHGKPFAVFMLDLDKFKDVNDALGHPAGDQLLQETAKRLKSSLRETDILARLGGDEFAIVQSGEADLREGATGLAARIANIISEPFDLDGNFVSVGTSIGIALAPDHGNESTELLKMADLALYRAKSAGRNGFRFFEGTMLAHIENRRQLEAELRAAISRSEFELHYQAIIDVKTRRQAGFEALVRWRHPTRGLLIPDQFIPLAEESGLIVPLGGWILQQACADAVNWPSHIKIAVNLSPVQLAQPDLLQIVLRVLVESSLAPERLELEITETALFKSDVDYATLIRQLKSVGVSISLDDFGTGYSSLSYLTMFPFDKIKIDRSFTSNLTRRADCAAIVSAVLALGRGLDTETVAEGVETEQQFGILRAAGVTFVQGYLFGRPCPASDLVLDDTGAAGLVGSAA